MISGIHTIIYSDDPDATRAFLRDVLRWPAVGEPDWPIFTSGPSEVGVHPTSTEADGESWSTPRRHELALMCDDIATTRAELESRGAVFSGPTEDMGWGIGAVVQVPGADGVLVYQPRHAVAAR